MAHILRAWSAKVKMGSKDVSADGMVCVRAWRCEQSWQLEEWVCEMVTCGVVMETPCTAGAGHMEA